MQSGLLKSANRRHRSTAGDGAHTLATALANKLARIAWNILRNEKLFDIHRHEVMAI
jgi:hypothetical protein